MYKFNSDTGYHEKVLVNAEMYLHLMHNPNDFLQEQFSNLVDDSSDTGLRINRGKIYSSFKYDVKECEYVTSSTLSTNGLYVSKSNSVYTKEQYTRCQELKNIIPKIEYLLHKYLPQKTNEISIKTIGKVYYHGDESAVTVEGKITCFEKEMESGKIHVFLDNINQGDMQIAWESCDDDLAVMTSKLNGNQTEVGGVVGYLPYKLNCVYYSYINSAINEFMFEGGNTSILCSAFPNEVHSEL